MPYLKVKHTAKSQTACEGRTESYGSHVDRQAYSEIIILSVNYEHFYMNVIFAVVIFLFYSWFVKRYVFGNRWDNKQYV